MIETYQEQKHNSNIHKKQCYNRAKNKFRNIIQRARKQQWLKRHKYMLELLQIKTGSATRLYFSLLKKQSIENTIEAGVQPVKNKQGILLTETSEILDEMHHHFSTLFNNGTGYDNTIIDELEQLDIDTDLEEVITIDEMIETIQQMKSGKATGQDGIPIEMLKKLKPNSAILKYLHKLILKCFKEGVIPANWRDAKLKVLGKGGDKIIQEVYHYCHMWGK